MPDKTVEHVWDLMEQVRFCMLATWNGTHLHARPMGAFVRRDENAIYFLADARRPKEAEIGACPQVCVAFADTHGQKYVSVSGTAEVSADRRKIRQLWSIPARIWWDTPEDPNIRLITIVPENAEYWDSPGNVVSNIKMAVALATGAHPYPGKHEKLAEERLRTAARGG